MATPNSYSDNVFINCPFDAGYHSLFEAIIFTIIDCGFRPRCALEENNSGNVRILKIMKIIDESRYGIHDLSKADLDIGTGLARFNMPLELGLFLGAHRYASVKHYNKEKKLLIMDTERFRYPQFISDLGGYDIADHNLNAADMITKVRDFLANHARRISVAGGDFIANRFEEFLTELPNYCDTVRWNRDKLQFAEFVSCVEFWVENNPV
jgi:hypothetical protein